MKLTCEQPVLLRAVQTVSRAVSTRTTMPILSNILLEATKDGLKLAATDLELGIQTQILARVNEGGAITLPARLLGEIVSNLPEAQVELRVEEGSSQAEILCENSSFEIHGLPAPDFPLIPEPDAKPVIALDPALLRAMIRQTTFAVSTDETRPFLTGVYVIVDGAEIRLVATDGGRLALRSAPLAQTAKQKLTAIIPAKTMQELARVLSGSGGEVTIVQAENQLIFTFGDVRLVSRLIAGQFPNYQQVIPQEYKQRLRLNTERFLRAVRRTAITARDSANVVRLTAKDGEMSITSNTPEVGKAFEKIAVQSDGEAIAVAFNAKYLLDCLSILETDELTFELTGPLSPGAIRPANQPDYVYVLAPVRVYS